MARNLTNSRYLTRNHIGYYAVGVLSCSITLVLLSRLVPFDRPMVDWARLPLALGTSSLMSFTLGNVVLNLLPSSIVAAGAARPVLASIALLLLVMAFVGLPIVERSYRAANAYRIRLRHPGG